MICKSCGAQIADNSVFCTNCGVRIQPVSEAVQGSTVIPPQAVLTPQAESAAQAESTAQAEGAVQVEGAQENTAPESAAQAEGAQENTAPESAAQAESTAQAEGAQENTASESAAQAESAQENTAPESAPQAENAQENTALESTPQAEGTGQPQMQISGMPDGQVPNGQPQMNGMPNGQAPYGQPQMNGMPNGQAPYGQPQMQMNGMPNGQVPYGQPQMQMNGIPNGQVPNGQPQMQMNGMPNAQAPNGQPQMQMNGMPNAQAPYGQQQAGSIPNAIPYGQAVQAPKKPFVMPAAVNVAGGILAAAAVAVFVCVCFLGKPEEKKSDLAVGTLAIPAQQQANEDGEDLNVDFTGVSYQLEIPETDGYRAAQELAESYIFEDSDTRYLEQADLDAHTEEELEYAFFEILARAGVDLSEEDGAAHEYFQRKSWYEPTISLYDLLDELDEEQLELYGEMIDNGENPIYDILLDAGVLNETEVYNMKLIEEYVTYGTTSLEGPAEEALEDMFEE